MQTLFRKLPAADMPPAEAGELYVLLDSQYSAQRAEGLASLVLRHGLKVFHQGPALRLAGPIERFVIDVSRLGPTLDDMLAATFARVLAEGRTLPQGCKALADYAAVIRQGLKPHQLAWEQSIEGIFLAMRNAAGAAGKEADLTDPEAGSRFLRDWGRLEACLLEAASRSVNPLAASLFAARVDFAREQAFLVKDYEVYLQDVSRGEKWRIRLPDRPQDASGLYLEKPKSLLFPHYSRSDRAAPTGDNYLFLAVNWGNGAWMFSTDPVQRLSIGRSLTEKLQRAERAHDAERAERDPWYDGHRPEHQYTLAASPRGGTALSDGVVLAVVKKWAGARPAGVQRSRVAVLVVAAAGLDGIALLLFFLLRERPHDPPGNLGVFQGKPVPMEFIFEPSPINPNGMLARLAASSDGQFDKLLPDKPAPWEFSLKLPEPFNRAHTGKLRIRLLPVPSSPFPMAEVGVQVNNSPGKKAELVAGTSGGEAKEFLAGDFSFGPDRNEIKVTITVKTEGRVQAEAEWTPNSRLVVFAVGVSKYKKLRPELGLPEKDARDVVAFCQGLRGHSKVFHDVSIYPKAPLVNENATWSEVHAGLKWMQDHTTPFDVALLSFSGHGLRHGADYVFAPYDFDESEKGKTGLYGDALVREFGEIKGKRLVIMDTCFSGGIAAGFPLSSKKLENMLILAGAGAGEVEGVHDDWGNGPVTLALLERMSNRLRYGDKKGRPTELLRPITRGVVSLDDLEAYVKQRADALVEEANEKLGLGPHNRIRNTVTPTRGFDTRYHKIPLALVR